LKQNLFAAANERRRTRASPTLEFPPPPRPEELDGRPIPVPKPRKNKRDSATDTALDSEVEKPKKESSPVNDKSKESSFEPHERSNSIDSLNEQQAEANGLSNNTDDFLVQLRRRLRKPTDVTSPVKEESPQAPTPLWRNFRRTKTMEVPPTAPSKQQIVHSATAATTPVGTQSDVETELRDRLRSLRHVPPPHAQSDVESDEKRVSKPIDLQMKRCKEDSPPRVTDRVNALSRSQKTQSVLGLPSTTSQQTPRIEVGCAQKKYSRKYCLLGFA
jgi:hypothetical protein